MTDYKKLAEDALAKTAAQVDALDAAYLAEALLACDRERQKEADNACEYVRAARSEQIRADQAEALAQHYRDALNDMRGCPLADKFGCRGAALSPAALAAGGKTHVCDPVTSSEGTSYCPTCEAEARAAGDKT